MNKIDTYLLPIMIIAIMTMACTKPRVQLDRTQWGDKAQITGVNVFRFIEVKSKLNYQDTVIGYQSQTITSTITIAAPESKVNIVTARGTDLTKIGIRISNFAERIEPVNSAPPAGLIGDFSKGPYTYRLYSADGTVRDWTLTFSVAP